jgi:frataxin-like iron-binding protein CyaY
MKTKHEAYVNSSSGGLKFGAKSGGWRSQAKSKDIVLLLSCLLSVPTRTCR